MAVMIDEVKFIFYSVLVGKGARESVLWLARLLAGSLHRGVPLVVLIDEVKFIFYSVLVGKGARFRVLWLARLLAGSLHRGDPLVVLIVMSNLMGYLLRSKSHLGKF
jgi:hypothetical protein